jgi:mannose-6-phosphate isomerase-like protein (cupin superfamily)
MGGPGGAAPHFHRTFSESFYILSGTVALYDGASWTDGTAGDFHYAPEGGIHAFRQLSDQEWTRFYAENDQYMV